MRIIVMADSHGALGRVRQIVADNAEANLFIHLGDGEDEFWQVAKLQEENSSLPKAAVRAKFISVKGNNDFFSESPKLELISCEGVRILLTHGDRLGVKYSLDRLCLEGQTYDAKVVLYGHTHRAREDYEQGVYYLNPGSVADSSRTPAGYMMLDITKAGIVPVFRQVNPSPDEY